MNWKQLKDFANSLNEDELLQEVKGWDEMRTSDVVGVTTTTETLYWDGYQHLPPNEFEDFDENACSASCLPKGTIRLNLY